MKININNLFFNDNEVDYKYLDNTCKIKRIHPWDSRHRSKESKFWLSYQIFNKRAERFVGQDISKLYNSYKKEKKTYHKTLISMFRDHIDILNYKGEIIGWSGDIIVRKYNDYYLDENNIIRKYDKKRYVRSKEKEITEIERVRDVYWKKIHELSAKKEILIKTNNLTYSALNRLLVKDIAEIKGWKRNYFALWNFKHKRIIRDKSDRNIRPVKIKPNTSNIRLKTIRKQRKVTQIIKPKPIIQKTIFTRLTGLQ